MKFENIVKQLQKKGYVVEPGQFDFKECLAVTGTCLVDVVAGEVTPTNAKFDEVEIQIVEGKSHIYNIEVVKGCKKKTLSPYQKWQE